MRYVSTRGDTRSVDFEGALFSGYAPDGGLYMPKEIPTLDYNTLRAWSAFSYPELVKELSSLFISSELIPRKELNDLIDKAFRRFRHKNVVHLARLKNGLNVLELWHGVTYAFKDLSMSCTGQFLQYFLKKRKKHITILVGTSGDTGSSAIESVRGENNMDIFVLLPRDLCSQTQELQMTTVIEENVHVFIAHGNSDEIDVSIKELFADADFSRKHNLMSLNSINWSRIMVQIAHYFYAYFQCTPSMDVTPLPAVEIVVPTGGGGNVTAGYIAQKMGLPIQLVAVVNNNDIIHRAIQHGDFSLSGRVKSTLASAMDIQEPYNMERIFWFLSDSDSSLIKTLMEEFYTSKNLVLPEELHRKLSEVLSSHSASDEDIVQAMRRCWEENRYLLCPHSAVAAHYHYKQLDGHLSNRLRCCLAPASAAKFPDAVLRAKLVPEVPPEIRALEEMETRSTMLTRDDYWAKTLRDRIEAIAEHRHTSLCRICRCPLSRTEAWSLPSFCVIVMSVASQGRLSLQYLQSYKKTFEEHDDFLEGSLLWDIAGTNSKLLVAFTEQLQTVECGFWARETSTDWWDHAIIQAWDDEQWLQNLQMCKSTCLDPCGQLAPALQQRVVSTRAALTVEKHLMIARWKLATPDC